MLYGTVIFAWRLTHFIKQIVECQSEWTVMRWTDNSFSVTVNDVRISFVFKCRRWNWICISGSQICRENYEFIFAVYSYGCSAYKKCKIIIWIAKEFSFFAVKASFVLGNWDKSISTPFMSVSLPSGVIIPKRCCWSSIWLCFKNVRISSKEA